MVPCDAGVGSIASRGIEQFNDGYSLSVQLVCMAVGLGLAYLTVKRFYRPKAISLQSQQPGESTANM
jgi:hypothetical protein